MIYIFSSHIENHHIQSNVGIMPLCAMYWRNIVITLNTTCVCVCTYQRWQARQTPKNQKTCENWIEAIKINACVPLLMKVRKLHARCHQHMLQYYWMITITHRERDRGREWKRSGNTEHFAWNEVNVRVWWSRVFWQRLSDACLTCLQFFSRGIELTKSPLISFNSFMLCFVHLYFSHSSLFTLYFRH